MKEFCGFEDSEKCLHRTKEDCEKAEINIIVNLYLKRLKALEYGIEKIIRGADEGYYGALPTQLLMENIAKGLLNDIDYLIELKQDSENIKTELDYLYNNTKERTHTPWYLSIKWWNK